MANKTSTAQKGIGYKIKNMTDTNMLLTITIVIFFLMYIGAIVFQGEGFLKPQTFLSMLNANAALIITSCGMSLVMITGGIDISVGGVVAFIFTLCKFDEFMKAKFPILVTFSGIVIEVKPFAD